MHRLFSAQEEICAISKELGYIEQIMLKAGGIHSGTLANAALDLAISIHGAPDDDEKIYAENITIELILKDKARAKKLVARRNALKTSIDREKDIIDADLSHLSKLEAKYEYASKLISNCALGAGLLIFALLVFKFLL
jgi:hypothetical protein